MPPVGQGLTVDLVRGQALNRPICITWRRRASPATYLVQRLDAGGAGGISWSSGLRTPRPPWLSTR